MRVIALRMLYAVILCIACSSTMAGATSCHMPAGDIAGGEGNDTTSLQFTYQFATMDRFREGGSRRSLDEAKAYKKPDGASYTSLPIDMEMVRYTMTAGYEFSSRFRTILSLPYVRNTMDMTSSLGAMLGWQDMTMAPTSGAGDATLLGLYRLTESNETAPAGSVFVGLGVKAPTGSSTERYSSGKLVHFHMQPGTGSWDPLLTIVYAKTMEHFACQANAAYQYTTSNEEGYEAGDTASAGLSGRYAVSKMFGISAGLNYVHTGKASDRNGRYYDPATNNNLMDDPANTGGDSLWFSPGIQALPMRNLALEAGVKVPLRERVNGIQLVASSIASAGISYRF